MSCTAKLYVESAESLEAQLVRIDAIIDALFIQSLDAAGHADKKSYMLDDGQVEIKTEYHTPKALTDAILVWKRFRQEIYNKLNGRIMVKRPARGMR